MFPRHTSLEEFQNPRSAVSVERYCLLLADIPLGTLVFRLAKAVLNRAWPD